MIESQTNSQPVKSGFQSKGFAFGSGVKVGGLEEKEQDCEKRKVLGFVGVVRKYPCPRGPMPIRKNDRQY